MKDINKSELKNLVIMLTLFDRNDPYYLSGLDRWIRDITQRKQYYGFTPLLKETLITNNLYTQDEVTPYQAKKISKKLKQVISDEIMIEHWKEIAENRKSRIHRPRQIYTGAALRDFTPAEQR